MTAEEFLEYIDATKYYRDKGKSRMNRARANYVEYVKAYREQSLRKLVFQGRLTTYLDAVLKACEDRDMGRPMAQVPELL